MQWSLLVPNRRADRMMAWHLSKFTFLRHCVNVIFNSRAYFKRLQKQFGIKLVLLPRWADGDQCGGGQGIEADLDERVPSRVAGGGEQDGDEDEAFHLTSLH